MLILGLGIGLNLATFQLLDTLFWSPPKLRDPASLVRFVWRTPMAGGSTVPYPVARVLAANSNALSAVLVRMDASDVGGVVWADDTSPNLRASFVSANWFSEIDYRPLRGRVFQEGTDDAPDAPPVVVISRGLWTSRFNEDPSIVGTTVKINNRPATIVGVVPPNIVPGHDSAFWMPVVQIDYFIPGTPVKTSWAFRTNRAEIYGRLKSGVSLAVARDASRGVMDEVAVEHPDQMRPGGWLEPFSAVTYFRDTERAQRDLISFTIAGGTLTLLILLIACANLSNLMLSRTTNRLRELAIRSALGANRWRVICHLLSESLVLVTFGSVGGMVLVYWMSRTLTVFWEYAPDFTPDLRTVFAGLLIGGFTIAAIGLIPALKLSRADLAAIMKDGGAQSSIAFGRTRLRQLLLAAQVGASCVLLVLAGLMLRSAQRVLIDVGFDVERVAVVVAPLRAHGIISTQITSYWNGMRDATASNSETESVALVARSPLDEPAETLALPNGRRVDVTEVGPEFFKVMRIPILSGRTFDNADEFKTAIVLSKSLAIKTYGTVDVIGKLSRKAANNGPSSASLQTPACARETSRMPRPPYLPLNPAVPDRELIIRARNDAQSLLPLIRNIAQGLNDKVIVDAHLLSRDFANRTVESRAMSTLMSGLALLAISLTSVGMIGIVSHAAALRRKEIGIRLALGANRRMAVRALVRDVCGPLLGGTLFGVLAGVGLGGMFAGVPLFVKPLDPPVLLAASLLLTTVAAIAAILPALRALRVDVVDSLRRE